MHSLYSLYIVTTLFRLIFLLNTALCTSYGGAQTTDSTLVEWKFRFQESVVVRSASREPSSAHASFESVDYGDMPVFLADVFLLPQAHRLNYFRFSLSIGFPVHHSHHHTSLPGTVSFYLYFYS